MLPWIQTFTGRQFFPLDPRADDVCLPDVAHALANVCRFNGHVRRFYSVAEHSVRVSILAERLASEAAAEFDPKAAARWGLLHDATEAYVCDLARPLKQAPEFAAYREAEKNLERVIAEAFGLLLPMPVHVRIADEVMLATEKVELLGREPASWGPLPEPLPPHLRLPLGSFGWDPTFAEGAFLTRARALS